MRYGDGLTSSWASTERAGISGESDLRAALNDIRSKIAQEMVDRTIDALPSRLDLLIGSEGRQFERKKKKIRFSSSHAPLSVSILSRVL